MTPEQTIAELRRYLDWYRRKPNPNHGYHQMLTSTLALMEQQAKRIRLLETTLNALFGHEWNTRYQRIIIDELTTDDIHRLYYLINDPYDEHTHNLSIPTMMMQLYSRLALITQLRQNERHFAHLVSTFPHDLITKAATIMPALYYLIIDDTPNTYLEQQTKHLHL